MLSPDITPLTPDVDVSTFSCADQDLDEFLKRDALSLQQENLTQVYVAYHESEVIGYVALLCDNIMLRTEEKEDGGFGETAPRTIPALKVGRLAVSLVHREKIKGVGTALMRFSFRQAVRISMISGCRLLSVDAYPDSVGFYKKLGFIENTHNWYQGSRRTTISMRFDIFQKNRPEWTNEPLL